jgi:hypothetical protein
VKWRYSVIVICSYDLYVVNKSNNRPKTPSTVTHTSDNTHTHTVWTGPSPLPIWAPRVATRYDCSFQCNLQISCWSLKLDDRNANQTDILSLVAICSDWLPAAFTLLLVWRDTDFALFPRVVVRREPADVITQRAAVLICEQLGLATRGVGFWNAGKKWNGGRF